MNILLDNVFPLQTKREIMIWLNANEIRNYTVNDDLTVDIEYGGADLKNNNYGVIPVQFNKVVGLFNCSNNQLKSLKGCPLIMDGHLNCYNNLLTNLKDLPKKVNGYIYCSENPLKNIDNMECDFTKDFYHSYSSGSPIEGFEDFYNIDDLGINRLQLPYIQFKNILLNRKLNKNLEQKNICINKYKI